MGQEKLKKKDLAGAAAKFREAVRLAPELAQAHLQLARVLQTLGRRQEARKHFAEAYRLAPYLEQAQNGK